MLRLVRVDGDRQDLTGLGTVEDALGSARRLVAEIPEDAPFSLRRLRRSIDTALSDAKDAR